ncbi:MAG: hypothetical protein BWY27_01324 [Bacteroidetes bacterium ADurb.Bin234]|nr:MAG: hypothetical protein BWY27_01324 [Bacteroidetes bacterium ADurb.Bin234]
MPLFLPFFLKVIKKTGALLFTCFSLILFPITFIIHKANLEGTENIKGESPFADTNLIAPQKKI